MGQFSWFTQDTHVQIFNDWDQHGDRQTIHMVDPITGEDYKEEGYEGYGVFGGRDFYEFLADLNKDIILMNVLTDDWSKMSRDYLKTKILAQTMEKYKCEEKTFVEFNREFLKKQGKEFSDEQLKSMFDQLFEEEVNRIIEKHQKGREYAINLFQKNWKDLTKDEIQDKRDYGIDLWCEHPERIIFSPILVEKYDTWKHYIRQKPEDDPDQGWHQCTDDEENNGYSYL